jgi:hypothetical protein
VIKLSDKDRLDFISTGMPADLWLEIVAYAERREPPGDFLRAVLEWDGMARYMPWGRHADACEDFLRDHLPPACRGGPEIVNAWCARTAVA